MPPASPSTEVEQVLHKSPVGAEGQEWVLLVPVCSHCSTNQAGLFAPHGSRHDTEILLCDEQSAGIIHLDWSDAVLPGHLSESAIRSETHTEPDSWVENKIGVSDISQISKSS